MPVIRNVVTGALKLVGVLERECFQSWQEFVKAVPQLYAVEVPTSITGIVFGNSTPSEDDRDKLWFRRSSDGTFIGLYAFQGGNWEIIPDLIPSVTVVKWVVGDSNSPPDGYRVIETGNPNIPSDVVNAIISQYVPRSGGGFNYFALEFIGY